jgi:hypothetical protein
MAKKPNLTPQRKAELKKRVLEALEKPQTRILKPIKPVINIIKEDSRPMIKTKTMAKPNLTKTAQSAAKVVTSEVKPKAKSVKTTKIKSPTVKKKAAIKPKAVKPSDFVAVDKPEVKPIATNISKVELQKPQKPSVDWGSLFPEEPKKKSFFKSNKSIQSKSVSLPWPSSNKKDEESDDLFSNKRSEKDNGKVAISWWRLALAAVLALLMVLVFDIIGIYKFGFNDFASYQVMKAFNLPAARLTKAISR